MIPKLRNFILDEINQIRSQVATGKVAGFEQAQQMPELKWDTELAYFAELNVRQCALNHDDCRSTRTYHYTGQHLATYKSTGGAFGEVEPVLRELINTWFEENKEANQSESISKELPNNLTIICSSQRMTKKDTQHFCRTDRPGLAVPCRVIPGKG
jgi:Cysteine-rich secretory protein family